MATRRTTGPAGTRPTSTAPTGSSIGTTATPDRSHHGPTPAGPGPPDPREDEKVANYRRLIEAELQIGKALNPHGIVDQAVIDAMEYAESDLTLFEVEHHQYLTVLTRFVEALGGRLELHAVFEDETVVVD